MADDGERAAQLSSERAALAGVPPPRVVLLGASNLTRCISTIVETARQIHGGPLEILAALGHGRSYGMTSAVLGRKLPGILQCGLWSALSALPSAPTTALVTDIGNDIVYGATVKSIVAWVDECLERLMRDGSTSNRAAQNNSIVLTLLPTESVTGLSQWRYSLLRTCVFPGCRLPRNVALSRAIELNSALQELAARRAIRTVRPRVEWYGFDPIHIRLRHWSAAWSEVLSPWVSEPSRPIRARGSLSRWLYLRSRAPEQRALFGFERRAVQPSGRLRDGTTIAIY